MSSQKVPSNLSLIFHVFAIIFVLSATKLSRHEILAEDFSDDSADLILTEEETVALESVRYVSGFFFKFFIILQSTSTFNMPIQTLYTVKVHRRRFTT